MKQLSIVVPSYNMERWLERCVISIVSVPEQERQALEVIIVNDGSTDSTSAIAHRLASAYPDVIRVIDKPNGHYGSCINAALPVATGRYFRIVDADDWVDTDVLTTLLQKLPSVTSDAIIMPFNQIEDTGTKTITISTLPEGEHPMDTLPESGYLWMHSLIYLTAHLQEIKYHQTEGICYTDNDYAFYPLVQAKSWYHIGLPLYQYWLGREGQSMDPVQYLRSRHHHIPLMENLCDWLEARPNLEPWQQHLAKVRIAGFGWTLTGENLWYHPYNAEEGKRVAKVLRRASRLTGCYHKLPFTQTLWVRHPRLYPLLSFISKRFLKH